MKSIKRKSGSVKYGRADGEVHHTIIRKHPPRPGETIADDMDMKELCKLFCGIAIFKTEIEPVAGQPTDVDYGNVWMIELIDYDGDLASIALPIEMTREAVNFWASPFIEYVQAENLKNAPTDIMH